MTLTEELCDRITAVSSEALDSKVIDAARTLILDGLAVSIAGARTIPAVEMLAEHLRTFESRPIASAFGLGFALAPVPAALLNGTSMHVLDFEPMWKPSTHALSTTLPAILALAEERGTSGLEIITALVKGIEIQGWLRQASESLEPKDVLFHQPGMVGPIGAAVAAGHLLKLDKDGLANAIGLAASRCGSLAANIGSMTKSTHCGYAASLGLESAMLAARGFTANPNALDHRQGYIAAFFPKDFHREELLKFGPPFRMVEPGFALKAYPCKYQTHYTIVCGLAARPQIPDIAAIRSIEITSPPFPAADRPYPSSGMEGMFSLQYTLAAALLDGDVGIASFTDERLARPDMQALLPKISLTMNPAISGNIGGRIVSVAIELGDGRIVREECRKPPGSWGAVPLPEDTFIRKVRGCLSTFLSDPEIERFIDLGSTFDRLDHTGVQRLLMLASGRS